MKDYVGQWFEIFNRFQEPTDILFLINQKNNTDLIKFSHDQADGVGALHALAKNTSGRSKTQHRYPPGKSPLSGILSIVCFFYTGPILVEKISGLLILKKRRQKKLFILISNFLPQKPRH